MLTLKKIKDDLDNWIFIGIGDDILLSAEHRPEYWHLVSKLKALKVEAEFIPKVVLILLEMELKRFVLFRPTMWRLLVLNLKRALRIGV